MCEPKKGNEELHGVCGTSDSPAQDWWLYTRSSQVHLLSSETKDGEAVNSSSRPVLNRAHISKLIHWEGVAEGIEAAGSDLPTYQLELIAPPASLVQVVEP